MKCSHGLDFEVKCILCFDEAMKRVSENNSPEKLDAIFDAYKELVDEKQEV